MSTESNPVEEKEKKIQVSVQNTSLGTVYGLGLIGAWGYYFSRATTFDERLKGFFKGFFWPATLVNESLKFFNPNSNIEEQ